MADDVKVVLIQNNDNKTVTTYDEGVKALENILADMTYTGTEDAKTFGYWFNVIVENGAAKVVVIKGTINGDYTQKVPTVGNDAGLKRVYYASNNIGLDTTAAVTADTTYTVTLSMVNGGSVVELATYDITVKAGSAYGQVTIGALAAGQQYMLSCGSYSNLIVC